jgi:hypothetical protein
LISDRWPQADSHSYTYFVLIMLSVLRILEPMYTRSSQVNDLLATAGHVHRLGHITAKIERPDSMMDKETGSPSIQGVASIGRTSVPSSPIQDMPLANSRPGIPSPILGDASFGSGRPSTRDQRRLEAHPPVSPITPSTSSPILSAGVSGSHSEELLLYHPATDDAAEAMVTDGYRDPINQVLPSLPPYTPGPSRGRFMDGHGDESNETRLSDYVKGRSRAQDMKDAGGVL